MKCSYLALAFVFVGTVVSAHMMAPAPGATASASAGSDVKDEAKAQSVAIVPSLAVSKNPAIRPPVPLLLSNRPTPIVKAGTLEMASRDPEPGTADAVTPDAKDPKTQTEGFARMAIELDGYKGVKGLAKGNDGVWRGRALRGTTEIAISVDANGNVSAR